MADTTKITVREVLAIHNALQFLAAGRAEGSSTTDEQGQEVPAKRVQYDFETKAKYAIIRNLAKTERELKTVEKLRDELIKDLSDGTGVIKEDDPEYATKLKKVTEGVEKALDTEIDIKLLNISVTELNLAKNREIDLRALPALDPILAE